MSKKKKETPPFSWVKNHESGDVVDEEGATYIPTLSIPSATSDRHAPVWAPSSHLWHVPFQDSVGETSWPKPCIRLSNAELGPFHRSTDDDEEGEGERNGMAGGATIAPEGSEGSACPGTGGRHWAEASEMLNAVFL